MEKRIQQTIESNLTKPGLKDQLREPISCITHFIPFVLSIPLLIIMLLKASDSGLIAVIGFFIFGLSLTLLYGTSAFYHGVKLAEHQIENLRRVDHMMIFVLIAGSYTPICLMALPGLLGKIFLGLVWGFALAGILMKIFWMDAPRWLSTLLYVIMGWLVVVIFVPAKNAISASGMAWLAAGGITYTVGAIIYATKASVFQFKTWSFHDIFHLFVIGGTVCHVIFMFLYIL